MTEPERWLLRIWRLAGGRVPVKELTGMFESELDELQAVITRLESER